MIIFAAGKAPIHATGALESRTLKQTSWGVVTPLHVRATGEVIERNAPFFFLI